MKEFRGDPKALRLNNVRSLIGDTDKENQPLTDGELKFFLDRYENDNFAAAEACDAIYAKLGAHHDFKRAKQFKELGNRLRMKASIYAKPFAGGIDRPKAFKRGSETKFKRGMI